RAAAFTIRSLLQWPRARCVRRAVNTVGKSLAACLAESSAAAGDGDNCSGVCVKRRKRCRYGLAGRIRTSHSDVATEKSPDARSASGDFESFSAYGVGAALASSFLSFLAPLPGFTSTLVADIV